MDDVIGKKSWYKLFISNWGIAIMLEAGYRELKENENKGGYIKICEKLYFASSYLPCPDSITLNAEELECFCKGLKLVSALIIDTIQNRSCLIKLNSIIFSDCNIQNDAITASAIQWASEVFGFSMPTINVWFDNTKMPCGKYMFDFSNI